MRRVAHCGAPCGFTLIELLVVLVILGVGWFSALPALDVGGRDRRTAYADLNELVESARDYAVSHDLDQEIVLITGEDGARWGDKRVRLPASLGSCRVNDVLPGGRDCTFMVYGDGVMDLVELSLSGGLDLRGDPLRSTFAPPVAR